MKPILVHVHIFYPDLWPELKACILNIHPYPFELFVTLVDNHTDIIKDVHHNFPKAKIEIVENRGYDIAPFIYILNQADLDAYSYIVKLHTKRDIPKHALLFRELSGSMWREKLLSFIKTPEQFQKYLDSFEKNEQIGMQNDYHLIVKNDFYDKTAQKNLLIFLKQNGLKNIKYRFVAGTMFFARACIFKDIQKLNISATDFKIENNHKSQLAHVFERLFGYFVYKNGFIVSDGPIQQSIQEKYFRKLFFYQYIIPPIFRFFYQKKRTKSGKIIIKICKIPVYIKHIEVDLS